VTDDEAIRAGQGIYKDLCEMIAKVHDRHKYAEPVAINLLISLAVIRVLIQNVHIARQLIRQAPTKVESVEDDIQCFREAAAGICEDLARFFETFDKRSHYEIQLVRKDKGLPKPGEN